MNLFVESTNRILIERVHDVDTKDVLNSASAVLTVLAEDGTTVIVEAITMEYVTGSNGNYRGIIPHTAELVVGTRYHLQIVLTIEGTGVLTMRTPSAVTAKYKPIKLT